MIYKGNQKKSRSPSSYRPISLANSIYKVYACMIQQRLSHSIDHLLPNQYGFRAKRSLSTPFFSCDDLPKYSNATPRPYISSSWFGHKPLTSLATRILLQPSADMVFPFYPSKQLCLSTRRLNFSLLIPLAIPPPFFSQKASDKDALSAPISSSWCFRHSPQISTPFSKTFSLIHLGLTHSHTHLLTWNMLMTRFSLPVLMTPSADFYIFSNTWPHELVFSFMDPNVSSSQSMPLSQFPSPSLPMQIHNASVTTAPPFSLLLRTFHLLMFHSPHSPMPNISVPSSLLPHRPFQTSTFVVLKPPQPSRHSIHSFDILLFLSDSSSGSIPTSSSPSFSTAQNLKSTPQHKLQKLTAATIKHVAKFSRFRVPTTIVFSLLLILPTPMNSSFHLHILSFHRAFPLPCVFPVLELNT